MHGQLIQIPPVQGVSDVIITIPIKTPNVRQRRTRCARVETLSAIGGVIQAMAVGIVRLKTQTATHSFLSCNLQRMIRTAGATPISKDSTKSWIDRRIKGHRREAALAPPLIPVRRGSVKRVKPARPLVSDCQPEIIADLMFDSGTPLHAIRIFQLTAWESIEHDWGDAGAWRSGW